MVLEERDDLVHRLYWSMATSLGLLYFLWVSSPRDNEIVDVEHSGKLFGDHLIIGGGCVVFEVMLEC